MRKKIIVLFLLFIVVAVLTIVMVCKQKEQEGSVPAEIQMEEEGESEQESPEKEGSMEPETTEEEDTLSMELLGLTDEMLSTMELEKKDVAAALKKWTQENGFSSAVGAEFYEPVWVRSTEQKVSVDCSLILVDTGNGIQKESEQIILTMDYFKSEGVIQFHY